MERRVLLAISLSFLVLFVYQTFFQQISPPPGPGNSSVTVPTLPGAPATGTAPGESAGPGAPGAAAAPEATPPAATLVGETGGREIVIETDQVRAVFTNQGGRIRHWQLKKYRNAAGAAMDLVP